MLKANNEPTTAYGNETDDGTLVDLFSQLISIHRHIKDLHDQRDTIEDEIRTNEVLNHLWRERKRVTRDMVLLGPPTSATQLHILAQAALVEATRDDSGEIMCGDVYEQLAAWVVEFHAKDGHSPGRMADAGRVYLKRLSPGPANDSETSQQPKVISRKTAARAGLKRYFTGIPCPHGHIAERRVSNSQCINCQEEWQQRHAPCRSGVVAEPDRAPAEPRGKPGRPTADPQQTHSRPTVKPTCGRSGDPRGPRCACSVAGVVISDHAPVPGAKRRRAA